MPRTYPRLQGENTRSPGTHRKAMVRKMTKWKTIGFYFREIIKCEWILSSIWSPDMIPWYIICKIRKVLYSERCPRLLEDFLQNFNETLNWSNLDFSYSLISNQLGHYIFSRGFNKINSQEYATSILRKNLLPRFNVVLRDERSSTNSAITKQISRTNLKTTKLDRVSETRLDSENQPFRTLALLRAESWKSLRALARCLQDYKNARYTRARTYDVSRAEGDCTEKSADRVVQLQTQLWKRVLWFFSREKRIY